MPAIEEGSKVLVTGSNGYIAMWVVRTLLEKGYRVRGTVRTPEKITYMKEYFAKMGYTNELEMIVVEDIVKEGAFDEAVKGVVGIVHMASPLHFNSKIAEDLYTPAIQGTVSILKSAVKHKADIKRIVVTSSFGAVISPPPPKPVTLSESDWNSTSEKEVAEAGENANPQHIYRASKKLAEQSAWGFYDAVKSHVPWDLTILNPPFAFGPPIHEVTSITSLNASLAMWYNIMTTPKPKEMLAGSYVWIDVRDAALAHVLALENDEAGGERIITVAAPYIWQEWLDILNSLSPNSLPSHEWQKGFPEILQGEKVYLVSADQTKQARILGIKFRTAEETVKDTLDEFSRRGW